MIARRVVGEAYTDEAFYFQGSFVDVDSAMAMAKDWIERQQDRGVF